jgi:hypothetical protein
VKCPACSAREIRTTTDQVSFYKSHVVSGDDGEGLDVEDGKHLADGEWWIDPDAETTCDACDHSGSAKEFGEARDKAMIVDGLDHFLHLEFTYARKAQDHPRTEAVSALLRLRGREDLAEADG